MVFKVPFQFKGFYDPQLTSLMPSTPKGVRVLSITNIFTTFQNNLHASAWWGCYKLFSDCAQL